MAKYKFTQSQFDNIRLLLKNRAAESRDKQKRSRAEIRRLGFMISDYFKGFTDLDFNKLLDKGEIEIVDGPICFLEPTSVMAGPKKPLSIIKTGISKHALPPIVDEATEYLVLGTMPGEQSLLKREYYNNPRNHFWNIISLAFNEGKQFADYTHKLKILAANKIGLWDVLNTCEREGSLDASIKSYTFNELGRLFEDFPNIKKVIFNGQDSYKYFKSLAINNGGKQYHQLTSTSSANTHKTVEKKAEEWKAVLT